MKISTFTDKHSMADHRLIFHHFCHLATEDCVARSFQRLLMIDLSKHVHDSLVVHLRRLEYCIDDRFIRKRKVVGERLLEGSLRGADGLRAGVECTGGFVRCPGMFGSCEDAVRCYWVRYGEEATRTWSVQESSGGTKERRTTKPGYRYALAFLTICLCLPQSD